MSLKPIKFLTVHFGYTAVACALWACSPGGGLSSSPVGDASVSSQVGGVNNAAPNQPSGVYSPEYAPPPVHGVGGGIAGSGVSNAAPTQASGVYSPEYSWGDDIKYLLKYQLKAVPQVAVAFPVAGVAPTFVKAKLVGDLFKIVDPEDPALAMSCEIFSGGGIIRIIDKTRQRYIDLQIKNHPVTHEPNYIEGVVEVAPSILENSNALVEPWYIYLRSGSESGNAELLGVYQECEDNCSAESQGILVSTAAPAMACS